MSRKDQSSPAYDKLHLEKIRLAAENQNMKATIKKQVMYVLIMGGTFGGKCNL